MADMGNSHVYLMPAKTFTFVISWFRLVLFLKSFRRREIHLLFFLAFSSLENKIITSYEKSLNFHKRKFCIPLAETLILVFSMYKASN